MLLPSNIKATKDISIYPSPIALFNNQLFNCYSCKYPMLEAEYQHLYFTSDEQIKESDWYIDDTNTIRKSITSDINYWQQRKDYRKIIATTDTSLGLPEPSKEFIQSYIEAYNKQSPITEVMIEYESLSCKGELVYSYETDESREQSPQSIYICNICGKDYLNPSKSLLSDIRHCGKPLPETIKVDSHNTVSIRRIKTQFTLEEIIKYSYWLRETAFNVEGYSPEDCLNRWIDTNNL